jgi:succinoglycan biosynthesis transport protein ExoP
MAKIEKLQSLQIGTLEPGADGSFDVVAVLHFIHRHLVLLSCSVIVFVALAVAYIMVSKPQYVAEAVVLIEPRATKAVDPTAVSKLALDQVELENNIEIIRSDRVALAIIRKHQLSSDPEFFQRSSLKRKIVSLLSKVFGDDSSLSGFARDFILPHYASGDYEAERSARIEFQRRLTVRRAGQALVLKIEFLASSAEKAALLANAVCDGYLADQLDAKYEVVRRTSSWLAARLTELRKLVISEEEAVQKFKVDKNIIEAGTGTLLDKQQLADLNARLVSARARTAEAEAKFEEFSRSLSEGDSRAMPQDAGTNPVLTKLREQYVELSRAEAVISARHGKDHSAVLALQQKMRDIDHLIAKEMERVASTYESEFKVAAAHQKAIEDDLKSVAAASADGGHEAVFLRELEREAESSRSVYQAYLKNYREAVQNVAFPSSEVQVLTRAAAPIFPAYPKVLMTFIAALAAGGCTGLGVAFVVDQLDRSIRSSSQIEGVLNVPCLGLIPHVTGDPAAHNVFVARKCDQDKTYNTKAITGASGVIEAVKRISCRVYGDSLPGGTSVIGVTSCCPGEGKSTLASHLASCAARTGRRTLLIRWDVRCEALPASRSDGRRKKVSTFGIPGEGSLETVSHAERSGLDVLGSAECFIGSVDGNITLGHLSDTISVNRCKYDVILVDLPPLTVASDACQFDRHVDHLVLVVEWGKTTVCDLSAGLYQLGRGRSRIVGTVLNKVALHKAALYGELFGRGL